MFSDFSDFGVIADDDFRSVSLTLKADYRCNSLGSPHSIKITRKDSDEVFTIPVTSYVDAFDKLGQFDIICGFSQA